MLKLLLGDPNARKLKRYQPIVSDINLLEEEIAPLTDNELRGKTAAFQQILADAGSLASQRPILDRHSQLAGDQGAHDLVAPELGVLVDVSGLGVCQGCQSGVDRFPAFVVAFGDRGDLGADLVQTVDRRRVVVGMGTVPSSSLRTASIAAPL